MESSNEAIKSSGIPRRVMSVALQTSTRRTGVPSRTGTALLNRTGQLHWSFLGIRVCVYETVAVSMFACLAELLPKLPLQIRRLHRRRAVPAGRPARRCSSTALFFVNGEVLVVNRIETATLLVEPEGSRRTRGN